MLVDVNLPWRDYALHQVVRQAVAVAGCSPASAAAFDDLPSQSDTLSRVELPALWRYILLSIPLPVLYLDFTCRARCDLDLPNVSGA